jgi:predicted adenylyl cyclase CyaB
MKNIEIEIKARIEKSKALVRFLNKNGKFVGNKRQVDEYFIPSHRDFRKIRPMKEWLRLRESDKGDYINYKNWYTKRNGISTYCDEFETEVEDINSLRKIFSLLNFKSIVKVDKKRRVWTYNQFEVALDTVKKLGSFVEIEYKGRKKVDPEKMHDVMVEFLKQHNCGKIELNYQGYPFLLMFPKEGKFVGV